MKSSKFWSIFKLYRPYSKMFIIVLINTLVASLLEFVYPYTTRWVTNSVIYKPLESAMHDLVIVAAILLGLYALELITDKVGNTALKMCDRITAEVEKKLFNHYEHQSFSYYDNNSVGEMMSIMEGDVDRLYDLLYCIPTNIMSIIINIIGCCVMFSHINLKLFIIFIPLVPMRLIYEVWVMKKLINIFDSNRKISRRKSSFIEDKLSGIRTTISFSNQDKEVEKFGSYISEYLKSQNNKWKWDWIHDIRSHTFSSIYYLFIHVYGIYLAVTGEMQIADLVVFYMYSYMIINPFEQLASMNRIIREGLVSYKKIQEVLSVEPEIQDTGRGCFIDLSGDIQFNDVSFQYSSSNDDVISHVNLHIPKGQFIAIVGPSGSGKSTLAGLIARFYEVSEGSITIDGTDIRDLDLAFLRRQVGVLQQNTYLFNGTIRDNISYGLSDVTEDKIVEAARQSNSEEFIEQLSDRYDATIGEKGVKLSGGQRQRIAIARLFLTNPSILIFDEATSSLDNASESLIQESMKNISKGRTTIVIAHRLSTIKNADRIIYLSDSGIEEDGTHNELMKLNGKYAHMYNQTQDRI